MKRNLISALQDRDRLPKKQPDWRLPPEWPARRSPVIWPAAEGWRGRDCDIVAHIDQHLGPCNSYRAEVCTSRAVNSSSWAQTGFGAGTEGCPRASSAAPACDWLASLHGAAERRSVDSRSAGA